MYAFHITAVICFFADASFELEQAAICKDFYRQIRHVAFAIFSVLMGIWGLWTLPSY